MPALPSPLPYTRTASAVFLLLLLLGPIVLVMLPSQVLVPGDAAATTTRVLAAVDSLRWGALGELTIAISELAMTLALYRLFARVQPDVAALAALSRFGMAAIQAGGVAVSLGVLAAADQGLPDLVLWLLGAKEHVALAWQGFFGIHCIALGYLIARSGFVPRALGPLMALAGLGYLVDTVGSMVAPSMGDVWGTVVAIGALGGEVPFFVWLLVRGIDPVRWREAQP